LTALLGMVFWYWPQEGLTTMLNPRQTAEVLRLATLMSITSDLTIYDKAYCQLCSQLEVIGEQQDNYDMASLGWSQEGPHSYKRTGTV
jgi:hypothetical protein